MKVGSHAHSLDGGKSGLHEVRKDDNIKSMNDITQTWTKGKEAIPQFYF